MQDPVASISEMGPNPGAFVADLLGHFLLSFSHLPQAKAGKNFVRIKTGLAHPLANAAYVFDPLDHQATLNAAEDYDGKPYPSVILYSVPPADQTVAFLTDHGFDLAGEMPVMAVEIDKLAPTSLPEGYRFEQVTSKRASDAWAKILEAGYLIPAEAAQFFSASNCEGSYSPDGLSQWFNIYKGQDAVASTMLYCSQGVAGIYCVATLDEERGKGLGAHAAAEPLRLAQRLGHKVGALQATDLGYPVYKRLGYQDLGRMRMFIRLPQV